MSIRNIISGGSSLSKNEKNISDVLNFFTPIYCLGLGIHKNLYNKKILPIHKLPKPVICVGNLTLGGSGKTPVVQELLKIFINSKYKPVLLTRGYKRKEQSAENLLVSDCKKILCSPEKAGDEPFQIALNNPGVPVAVGADRYKSARMVLKNYNPDLFILDDGFQHWQLKKDFNIICISASENFQKSRMLPAGNRREPFSAVKRGDLIIITNAEPENNYQNLIIFIKKIYSGIPILLSRHEIKYFIPVSNIMDFNKGISDWGKLSPAEMEGKTILAFSGIANNNNFFTCLKRLGINVIKTISYMDHYSYTEKDIKNILSAALSDKIDLVITTEKDAVKISRIKESVSSEIPIYFSKLNLAFHDKKDSQTLLDRILDKVNILNK